MQSSEWIGDHILVGGDTCESIQWSTPELFWQCTLDDLAKCAVPGKNWNGIRLANTHLLMISVRQSSYGPKWVIELAHSMGQSQLHVLCSPPQQLSATGSKHWADRSRLIKKQIQKTLIKRKQDRRSRLLEAVHAGSFLKGSEGSSQLVFDFYQSAVWWRREQASSTFTHHRNVLRLLRLFVFCTVCRSCTAVVLMQITNQVDEVIVVCSGWNVGWWRCNGFVPQRRLQLLDHTFWKYDEHLLARSRFLNPFQNGSLARLQNRQSERRRFIAWWANVEGKDEFVTRPIKWIRNTDESTDSW